MQVFAETEESQLATAIASLNTSEFPNRLNAWLQTCLPYDNITILAYFQNQRPVSMMFKNHQPKVHENISQVYLAGAYLLDPFHDLHVNNAPAGVYRLSDIAPDKFRRNQYFIEYYRNTTMVDELAFISYPSPNISLHVCLGRDSNSNKRFAIREIANAHRLSPLVTTLTSVHWKGLMPEGESAEGEFASNLIKATDRAHGISLSPRQAEVTMLVLRGHSSVSIGLRLGISYQTVKVFRKQLYRKCKISSQAELFNLMLPILGSLSESRK
ncbi:MAG: helix-turn-helix transcriptional regulator [Proteobacteria bacterium]|nr:helix-turn-helix transcriptional regulator [Pseudomonadota bacterium]